MLALKSVVLCAVFALVVGHASLGDARADGGLDGSTQFFNNYIKTEKITGNDLINLWYVLRNDVLMLRNEKAGLLRELAEQFEPVDPFDVTAENLPRVRPGDMMAVVAGSKTFVIVFKTPLKREIKQDGEDEVINVTAKVMAFEKSRGKPGVLRESIEPVFYSSERGNGYSFHDFRHSGVNSFLLKPKTDKIFTSAAALKLTSPMELRERDKLDKALFTDTEFKFSKIKPLVVRGADVNAEAQGRTFFYWVLEQFIMQHVLPGIADEPIEIRDIDWLIDMEADLDAEIKTAGGYFAVVEALEATAEELVELWNNNGQAVLYRQMADYLRKNY